MSTTILVIIALFGGAAIGLFAGALSRSASITTLTQQIEQLNSDIDQQDAETERLNNALIAQDALIAQYNKTIRGMAADEPRLVASARVNGKDFPPGTQWHKLIQEAIAEYNRYTTRENYSMGFCSGLPKPKHYPPMPRVKPPKGSGNV